MNKILPLCLLAAAGTAYAGNPRFVHAPFESGIATSKTITYSPEEEADTFKVSLLMREDFAAFSEGSEEEPAETPISTQANWLPLSFTPNSGQWGGEKIYQAGGCAYIHYEGGISGGLTTPSFNMSENDGPVIVTMRSKKGQSTDPDITRDWTVCDLMSVDRNDPTQIQYCQRDYGNNYDEWNDYKFIYNFKRDPDKDYYFLIYGYDCGAYVDNVEIKFLNPYVEAPVTKAHSDFTNDGFTVNWEPVADADHYLIDIFTIGTDRYKTRTYIHRDFKAEGTSHRFEGIETRGKAYYYVVKAVRGEKISPESKPVKVEALIHPTNLSASNVNGTITLSWSPVPDAQYYLVQLDRKYEAKADENYILCRDNFDEIGYRGEYLDPYYLHEMTIFDGIHGLPGWGALNGLIIEGAIGVDGTAQSAGYSEAYFQSNQMDLTSSNGEVTVKVDMYNVDEIGGAHYSPIIRLKNVDEDGLTLADQKGYRAIFDEWQTVTATLTGGSSASVIELSSPGGWVYFDNLEISRKLKAGDCVVSPVLDNAQVEEASVEIPLTDMLTGHNLSFYVTAVKEVWDEYGFSINYYVRSAPSETYSFDVEAAGIESVETSETAIPADVYNLQGIRVLEASQADRINDLPAGIYISGGRKIVIK